MELVLQKIKQAKTRGVFKRKNVLDEKTVGFEPSSSAEPEPEPERFGRSLLTVHNL